MVGFAKTNHFPTLIQERQRSDRQLDLRNPTPFQPSYLKAHGWNDGWFRGNQPRSNLRNLKHMVGMTVGLRKTNRFLTLIHERQRMDWGLVLWKSTPIQPSYLEAHGCNYGWFCENQPGSNHRILMHVVGITGGFTKTKHFSTLIQERQRSDRQLDLRKPTPFQPSYLKAHGWNDG